ncbi:MAG: DUF5666 domain-containing protein [Candidatus Paceibacterota bacterium]|jgi:hypothetical protein
MNAKTIAIFLVIILAVGGGSFYGGMKYSQSQVASKFANRGNGSFQQGAINNATGTKSGTRANGSGGMVAGEITAKDDQSITVKSRDGSSKIIFTSSATETLKQASGSLSDLVVGNQVTVTGTADASGNITAKSIQIMPTAAAGEQAPNGQPPAAN